MSIKRIYSIVLKLLILLVLGLWLLPVFSCADSQSSNLPANTFMFRGNSSHTGWTEEKEIGATLSVKWKYFNNNKGIASSPVVADGIVYFGSLDHSLYALDADSGQLRWRFGTGNGVISSPAISDGVVYFGSADGIFYALDSQTGEKKWSFETTIPDSEANSKIESSPVVVEKNVYFGTKNGRLFALNAVTGDKIWEYSTNSAINESPAVVNGIVYFFSLPSLYAIDAKNGTFKWKIPIHNGLGSTPVVSSGSVLYDDGVNISAYAWDTGDKLYEISTGHGSWDSNPAVKNDVAFFGNENGFHAIDVKSGTQLWINTQVGKGTGIAPIFAGNEVIFIDSSANIDLFDSSNGELKGKYKFQTDFSPYWAIPTSMAINDGVIYLGSMDGNIYAIQGQN